MVTPPYRPTPCDLRDPYVGQEDEKEEKNTKVKRMKKKSRKRRNSRIRLR